MEIALIRVIDTRTAAVGSEKVQLGMYRATPWTRIPENDGKCRVLHIGAPLKLTAQRSASFWSGAMLNSKCSPQ
jgi:hypothetical protein